MEDLVIMEYGINGLEGTFGAELVRRLDDSEYVVRIGDAEKTLRIISMDAGGIEFLLDSVYHRVKYLHALTAEMELVVDSVPMTVRMHQNMDEVVYKNSGGGGQADAQTALRSQIPGKVVSVDVEEGAQVARGDVVCTLESMKMQVGVKAHMDGKIKSVKVKTGSSVAKNDIIAELE